MLFFMKVSVFLALLSFLSKSFYTLCSISYKFFPYNDYSCINLFVFDNWLNLEAELRIDLDEKLSPLSMIFFFYPCFGITVVLSFLKDFTNSLMLSMLCGLFGSFSFSVNFEKDPFASKVEVFSWLLLFLYIFRKALQLFLMWGGS